VRSVGLLSPSEFTRHHVVMLDDLGKARPLSDLYPYPPGTDPGCPPIVAKRALA